MWSTVVTVVVCSCVVSSAFSVADLQDNVVPEESLQDLTPRMKKSPAEDDEKSSSNPESKSDPELTAVLTQDIKRKIEDLKELKNAYHKVEADFFGSDDKNLKSSVENNSSEKKNPLESPSESDDESVRIARQYFPNSYSNNQYQDKKYVNDKGMFPENFYSNGKYQFMGSSSDRDAPYIAQYNPSSRTFGAAGVEGGFSLDINQKVPDIKPEATFHIPAISIKPVEHAHPAPPIHTSPPATTTLILPSSLPTEVISEHKPPEIAVHPTKHDSKAPLYYEKKEIGTPGSYFSKQIIYGPSKDFDEGHSYHPYTYSSYPQGGAYLQPGYSSYPQGYLYGSSPSYWYASDGYSSPGYSGYSGGQAGYNYAPAYSPGHSYQQGQAYYPAGGNFRSHADLSGQFQSYQDELDSLLSQFFRADSADGASDGNLSSAEQLKEDIEKEQKRIRMLQEELKTPHGSTSDGSNVSQSFTNWLSGEMDSLYSRWVQLKDDLLKPKQSSEDSAKTDLKTENIKV